VRSALKLGATEDEILEAIEVVGIQKIHSLTSMLPVLVEEVERFRQQAEAESAAGSRPQSQA
jgi:alkylhydroperoxidase/carboxymuconolactone decarboxylase family protein YurZ